MTLDLKAVAASVDVVTSVDALLTSTSKFTEPLRDTPQTIDIVSQKTMQEQGVTTLRDGLRNVAGISMAAGEGGSQGDNLTIRGFSARNDLYIDGMRDFGSYYRDPFNLDEIEVIQGPESTNFGRGSTGGVVNQATKFPNMNRMFSGTFDGGTDGTRRLTTDFNVPFTALGTQSAFRLNLMGDEGGVAGRPVVNNKRYGIAPSLYFGLGTRHSHRHQRAQPAGRRYSGLRHSVAVQQPSAGLAQQLLRFREWRQLSAHARQHRHGSRRARLRRAFHAAQSEPLCALRPRRAHHRTAGYFDDNRRRYADRSRRRSPISLSTAMS